MSLLGTFSVVAADKKLPLQSGRIANRLYEGKSQTLHPGENTVFIRPFLQALIIGPEGTPYSNAPLVFDIFLRMYHATDTQCITILSYNSFACKAHDYDLSPPLCKIITTHGGRYR